MHPKQVYSEISCTEFSWTLVKSVLTSIKILSTLQYIYSPCHDPASRLQHYQLVILLSQLDTLKWGCIFVCIFISNTWIGLQNPWFPHNAWKILHGTRWLFQTFLFIYLLYSFSWERPFLYHWSVWEKQDGTWNINIGVPHTWQTSVCICV